MMLLGVLFGFVDLLTDFVALTGKFMFGLKANDGVFGGLFALFLHDCL